MDIAQIHAQTLEMIKQSPDIDGMLVKEYNRAIEQYESMYKSLGMFMDTAKNDETRESLKQQQEQVLENMAKYELEFQKRL